MRIVIIGSGGRLGAALMGEYRAKYDVAGFNHAQLDLSNLDGVREKLRSTNFDVLINAAAFTNVSNVQLVLAGIGFGMIGFCSLWMARV